MDPAKLKVAELRQELQDRGLDSKGNKPVLVERLREALEAEPTEGSGEKFDNCDIGANMQQNNDDDDAPIDNIKTEPGTDQNYGQDGNQYYGRDFEKQQKYGYPVKEEKEGYEQAPPLEADVKVERNELKHERPEVKHEPVQSVTEDDRRRGEKRRSRSRSRSPQHKRYRPEVQQQQQQFGLEDEPDFDKSVVALDWYNSDLSLVIDENRMSASPLTSHGFAYVWHGVKATYGYTFGRIFYEVKIEQHISVPQLEESEQHPHVVRVGWSTDDAGITLGEEQFSYGYGGTSKASTNLKFKDYGVRFKEGDTVGCFLDMEVEPIIMAFQVNGRHQGICYEIPHHQLKGQALFPHILTKNCSFKVNFGDEEPWFRPLTGYTFAGQIPVDDRVIITQGPEQRSQCEVLMMIGLPAAGKTTWIEKYTNSNRHYKFNILGTNTLIDKMKMMGLPRKRNYHGRWDVLIESCTKALNLLLSMGYKRRRHFIIDQTNVYPSAQRRKMKGFAGFHRRAVIICPNDEDLQERFRKQSTIEGKEVPEKAVLEMKANFKIPEEDSNMFDSIEFVELDREEAERVVTQYNKEAESKGIVANKWSGGGGNRGGGGGQRGFGGGGGHRGDNRGYRGGWDRDRDRRGGFDNRDRSGGGGGGGGGWNRDRDNRDYNRGGGYNRDNRGGGNSYNRDNRGGGYRNNYNRDNRDNYGGGGGGGSGRDYNNRDNYSGGGSRDYNNRDNYGGGGGGRGYGGRDNNYNNNRDHNNRDGGRDYNRDNRSGGNNRDRGSGGGRSNWNRNENQHQPPQQQPQQQQPQPAQQYQTTSGYGDSSYSNAKTTTTATTTPTNTWDIAQQGNQATSTAGSNQYSSSQGYGNAQGWGASSAAGSNQGWGGQAATQAATPPATQPTTQVATQGYGGWNQQYYQQQYWSGQQATQGAQQGYGQTPGWGSGTTPQTHQQLGHPTAAASHTSVAPPPSTGSYGASGTDNSYYRR